MEALRINQEMRIAQNLLQTKKNKSPTIILIRLLPRLVLEENN